MKSILYHIVVFLIALVTGCNKDDSDITPQKSSLNLVSPNGIKIAEDINSLKLSTSEHLSSLNNGMEVEFEITDIEYATVPLGFIAFIVYRLDNGNIRKSALLSKEAHISMMANSMVLSNLPDIRLKNRSESGGSNRHVDCVGSCNGTGCSLIIRDIPGEGRRLECYPGCEDCSMVITYY
jgi:hypothetical protein